MSQATVAARLRSVAIAPRKNPREISSVMTEMMPHFRSWAPRFARSFATTPAADTDDAVSLCAMQTFETLSAVQEDSVADWYAYLYGSCKYRVLSHFESSSVTIAGGMTTIMRERRQSIPDAAHTIDDTAIGYTYDEFDAPTVDGPESGFVISEVEGRELAQMIIEAAYERSDILGAAADEWLGGAYAEPPMIQTGSEIGRSLDVGAKKGCALLVQLRQLAQQVCSDEFGIDSPFR